MIQKALVSFIESNVANTDVYSVGAKPNVTAPYIVVELETSNRQRHFGSGDITTGLKYYDFEISCYAKTVQAVSDLAKSLVTLLENFQGPMRDLTTSPATVYRVNPILIISESQNYEAGTELYRYSIFLTIPHR